MTNDTSSAKLHRSCSEHHQRKSGCSAFLICIVISAAICMIFESYILNLKLLMTGDGLNMLMDTIVVPHQPYSGVKEMKQICDFTRQRANFCDMEGDIRIHGNSSTIIIVSNEAENFKGRQDSWKIKPYARKEDSIAMGRVKTITAKIAAAEVSKGIPKCSRNYSSPAIVFSNGGYARNYFHAFTDIMIPLYLTSIEFKGDVWFLITDIRTVWIQKHQQVLQKLSNYQPIDIDQEREVFCFPRIILGLKATDKEFSINSSQSSHTMKEFRQFLRAAYGLNHESAYKFTKLGEKGKRLRLLLISRKVNRRLLNEGEVAKTTAELGFEVVVKDLNTTESATVSKLVNSADVLVGVHGAGLTHMVFLPENAVVIQIVPLGEMEWLAGTFFEKPAKDMNLHYLEYKISPNESTLTKQFTDKAKAEKKEGWRAFKSIFMEKQHVILDVTRFRNTLLKARELLQS